MALGTELVWMIFDCRVRSTFLNLFFIYLIFFISSSDHKLESYSC